jgi:hypothetical protein
MRKYSEFGISFSKSFLVSKGASPVFYVARSSMVSDLTGSTITRAEYFDENVALYQRLNGEVERALLSQHDQTSGIGNKLLHLEHLLDFHVFSFIKFFDPAQEQDDLQDFYMEREWRVYGNVNFHISNVSKITLPGEYVGRFGADFPATKDTLLNQRTQSHKRREVEKYVACGKISRETPLG